MSFVKCVQEGNLINVQDYLNEHEVSEDEIFAGFLLAIQRDFLPIVEYIFERYRNVINKQDSEGQTALHHMIKKEAYITICKLLYLGADVTIRDRHNITPKEIGEKDLLIKMSMQEQELILLINTREVKAVQEKLSFLLEKLDQLHQARKNESIIKNSVVSFLHLNLGGILSETHPHEAMKLFRKIPFDPNDNYFQRAHKKIYYLIQSKKVKYDDENQTLYHLIESMVYAMMENDDQNNMLKDYILFYTKETADNIPGFNPLSNLLKPSIPSKKIFLDAFQLIHRKNLEIERLKKENEDLRRLAGQSASQPTKEIKVQKETEMLPGIPEQGRLVISGELVGGSPARVQSPPLIQRGSPLNTVSPISPIPAIPKHLRQPVAVSSVSALQPSDAGRGHQPKRLGAKMNSAPLLTVETHRIPQHPRPLLFKGEGTPLLSPAVSLDSMPDAAPYAEPQSPRSPFAPHSVPASPRRFNEF